MADASPQCLKRSGDDLRGRDRALRRVGQRQSAAQIDHREIQRQRRLQFPEGLRAAAAQFAIVHLEHGFDGFLMAITKDIVAGSAAGRAEVVGRGVLQVERQQPHADGIAGPFAVAFHDGRFLAAGRPQDAWIEAGLHRIQAHRLAAGQAFERARHLEYGWNLELSQQRGCVARDIAPLGHQSGDARQYPDDFRRGLADENHRARRDLADILNLFDQKRRAGSSAGIHGPAAGQPRFGLGNGTRFGTPGVGVRQGARLDDPQRAIAVEHPFNVLRRPEMALNLHAPIGQGVQINIRQAGLLLHCGHHGYRGDAASLLQDNFFCLLGEVTLDHGMRRGARHQEEVGGVVATGDAEPQTSRRGNPESLAFRVAWVARVHDAGRARRNHLDEQCRHRRVHLQQSGR